MEWIPPVINSFVPMNKSQPALADTLNEFGERLHRNKTVPAPTVFEFQRRIVREMVEAIDANRLGEYLGVAVADYDRLTST